MHAGDMVLSDGDTSDSDYSEDDSPRAAAPSRTTRGGRAAARVRPAIPPPPGNSSELQELAVRQGIEERVEHGFKKAKDRAGKKRTTAATAVGAIRKNRRRIREHKSVAQANKQVYGQGMKELVQTVPLITPQFGKALTAALKTPATREVLVNLAANGASYFGKLEEVLVLEKKNRRHERTARQSAAQARAMDSAMAEDDDTKNMLENLLDSDNPLGISAAGAFVNDLFVSSPGTATKLFSIGGAVAAGAVAGGAALGVPAAATARLLFEMGVLTETLVPVILALGGAVGGGGLAALKLKAGGDPDKWWKDLPREPDDEDGSSAAAQVSFVNNLAIAIYALAQPEVEPGPAPESKPAAAVQAEPEPELSPEPEPKPQPEPELKPHSPAAVPCIHFDIPS
eukprot:SAG25_NODE_1104_length_3966_cov_11.231446_2_plen_399_part_00